MDFNTAYPSRLDEDVSEMVVDSPSLIPRQLNRKIVVMDKQECVFLKIDHILYAEANGSYTNIYLADGKKMIVSKNIRQFSDKVPEDEFVRVHKSYIININSISRYVKSDGGYVILENGKNIPVSVRKKQMLTSLVDQWVL